jgi:hypothetical protein
MIEKFGKASILELESIDHEKLLRDIKHHQGIIIEAMESNEP